MPMFIDTRGRTKIAISICARCSRKFPYDELVEDGNIPGLFVCPDDRDEMDRWRLAPRATEDITLEHPRPDVSLPIGPQSVPINPLQAGILDTNQVIAVDATGNPITLGGPASTLLPSVPWSANTAYGVGAQVTATNPIGTAAAGILFPIFLCIVPGMSGAMAPVWFTEFATETTDGTVIWINSGLYLP